MNQILDVIYFEIDQICRQNKFGFLISLAWAVGKEQRTIKMNISLASCSVIHIFFGDDDDDYGDDDYDDGGPHANSRDEH